MTWLSDYQHANDDPNDDNAFSVCQACNGEGRYYEDVAGDGGSQMLIECDCNWRELFDANNAVIGEDHNVWPEELETDYE